MSGDAPSATPDAAAGSPAPASLPGNGRVRTWIGVAAVLLAGGGFVLTGGLAGALAAAVLAVAWYALPVPYAVAVGHLLLVGVVPGDAALVRVAPAEAGLLGVLLSEASTVDAPGRFVAAMLAAGVVLLGAAWAGSVAGGLPGAAVALVVVGAVLGYALHRYELLRLGLLDPDHA
jgi:hypothetical protein